MVSQSNARKIQKLPTVNETVVRGNGDSVTVRTKDRVYVIPRGSLANKNLQRDFRIARVADIREKPGAPAWFFLQFYTGHTDIRNHGKNLSPTELVLHEDDEDWLPAEKIIDRLGEYFQEFDDALPNPPRMNSQIWFTRLTKSICPVCKKTYAPHKVRQRYCHQCQVWIDVKCLGNKNEHQEVSPDFEVPSNQGTLDIESLGPDGLPEILNEVLRRPTVRGHMGEYNFDDNWAITGSGSQQGLIQEWREGGVLPENWLALLGENFLQDFVIGKTWKRYPCPRCSYHI